MHSDDVSISVDQSEEEEQASKAMIRKIAKQLI